ncbi:MAG: aminoacyl-tRNA hydrolase [bacterium]|nr:aminoacyl-tRNA hydrolase [bacterium]
MIKLIIGLGNPGAEYQKTYHNIGQIFLNSIVKSPWKRIARKHFVYSELGGVILIKPTCFMNESGIAANEALSYFKIIPSSLLVVHDDSDFIWGTHKIAFAQGPAGHNGVKSIILNLGTKNFWRLRVGVRENKEVLKDESTTPILRQGYDGQAKLPPTLKLWRTSRRTKSGDFVLKKLTKKHQNEAGESFANLQKEILQIS